MSEITHTGSPARQIVSAEDLRRILRAAGDSSTRPSDFAPGDEWDAGDAPCRFCAWTDAAAHEDGCPESEPASGKHLVSDWETVTTYVAIFPNGDDDGAADVEAQIGTDGTRWYLRTRDDAGGSDDCDDTAYDTRKAAETAAEELAIERDDGDGENAAGYIAAQLEAKAGEPDPEGTYCVYWETTGDDERLCQRYATLAQAQAAAARAQEELETRHPGGNLLCGYAVRVLDEDGEWVAIEEDAR